MATKNSFTAGQDRPGNRPQHAVLVRDGAADDLTIAADQRRRACVELKLNQAVSLTLLPLVRKQALIDVVGQRSGMGRLRPGIRDQAAQVRWPSTTLSRKPSTSDPRGSLRRLHRIGFAPNDQEYRRQSPQHRARLSSDLVITPAVFNQIGPAINSAASIFLFCFSGNARPALPSASPPDGRQHLYPYAIEVGGSIIKLLDPTARGRRNGCPRIRPCYRCSKAHPTTNASSRSNGRRSSAAN